jgi:hypothetical protein
MLLQKQYTPLKTFMVIAAWIVGISFLLNTYFAKATITGYTVLYRLALFALLLLTAAAMHFMVKKNNHSFVNNNYFQFGFCAAVCIIIYLFIPVIILDDAAIILRYMDNFSKGIFFKYNASDAPVYGVSGFLHGLLGGTLSYLKITTATNSLKVSNIAGFIISAWYLFKVYKKISNHLTVTLLAFLFTITSAGMFLLVVKTGMETPLHLAFIMAGIYYLLINRHTLFFLCGALMIISKLDALPVLAVCFGYFIVQNSATIFSVKSKKIAIDFLLYFLLPALAGFAFITVIFGSPLPQSAFAKLYYHAHPNNHWFPFLTYFLNNRFLLVLLVAALTLWAMAVAEFFIKKDRQLLQNSLFGSVFLSQMALYYYYNPGEQMIWYYAIPEFFLMVQLVTGIIHFVWNNSVFRQIPAMVVLVLFFATFCFNAWYKIMLDMEGLRIASILAEGERTKIGKYIAAQSTVKDTLAAGHGLTCRPFPGYVLDVSGLNSKLATDYKLNGDELIKKFRPRFMINHGFPGLLVIGNKYNYRLVNIYRNINLYNALPWVLLERNTDTDKGFTLQPADTTLNKKGLQYMGSVLWFTSQQGVVGIRDTAMANSRYLHVGIKNEWLPQILVEGFFQGRSTGQLKPFITSTDEHSGAMCNLKVDISKTDSVAFTLKSNMPFSLAEPVYELIK